MNSDTSMPSPESVHISVLLNEAVDALAPKAGGRYLDGTVGMGGHSFAIMERTGGEGFLCGLDRDTQALELARIRLAPFGDRVHLVHTRYSEFEAALDGIGWDAGDGGLIDIGCFCMLWQHPVGPHRHWRLFAPDRFGGTRFQLQLRWPPRYAHGS